MTSRTLALFAVLSLANLSSACGAAGDAGSEAEVRHELDVTDASASHASAGDQAYREDDPTGTAKAGPSKPTPDPWSAQTRTAKPTPDPWQSGTGVGKSGTGSDQGK
jgi:hypothetical protein